MQVYTNLKFQILTAGEIIEFRMVTNSLEMFHHLLFQTKQVSLCISG